MVELVIIVPALLMVVVGAVEVARMIFIIHAFDLATRNGVRAGIVELNTTTANQKAVDVTRQILAEFGLDDQNTTVTSSSVTVNNFPAIQVTASRPFSFPLISNNFTLARTATMAQEA